MSIPFMQLYVADYLGDTQHLTTEQHGAYMLIMMAMWRCGGRLASDDQTMRQVARLTQGRWKAMKTRIFSLFEDTGDGHMTQKRLAAEYEKATKKSVVRSKAGRAGVLAKSLKSNGPKPAKAKPLLKHSSESEPEKKKVREKAPAAPSIPGLEFPTWWPTKEWAAFVESRRKIKKPLTDHAVELAIKRLTELRAAGEDPAEILNRAVFGSWTGLYGKDDKRPGEVPANVVFAQTGLDGWVHRLREFYFGALEDNVAPGYWQEKFGPKPDAAGCVVPESAVKEFERRFGPIKNIRSAQN